MKKIKSTIFAILMACAAMPAWGMDYFSALTNMAAPLLPALASAYVFTVKPKSSLAPCTNDDLPAIDAICKASFNVDLASYSWFLRAFSVDQYPIRVWKENNTVLGSFFYDNESSIKTFIHTFAVKPDAQRGGIGSAMLKDFEKERAAQCPSNTCTLTLISAPSALGFYAKNGFTCDENRYCTKEFLSTMHDLKKENRI